MTNHHVGSGQLKNLSTPDRDLLLTGFYAPTLADELKCQNLEVRILMSIEDVTDRINAAVKQVAGTQDAAAVIRTEIAAIEKKSRVHHRVGLSSCYPLSRRNVPLIPLQTIH